jgi:hypothetical protein
MIATLAGADPYREELLGELTDAAFEVASRHGVKGPSVDQEVELWNALCEVVRKQCNQSGVARARSRPVDLPAELTDAAYRVALEHGFRGSFLDLRLDLWKALRRAFL